MNLQTSGKQPPALSPFNAAMVLQLYEQGCKALAECRELAKAKYWDNMADAMAAWAKIHDSEQATKESRQLKLQAYRAMGRLAAQMRPPAKNPTGRGMAPGSRQLLQEHGLTANLATAASRLGSLPAEQFEELVNRPRPPSPTAVTKHICRTGSDAWLRLSGRDGPALMNFRVFCRRYDPVEIARELMSDEAAKARVLAIEISEWLDKFERHLPKPNGKGS